MKVGGASTVVIRTPTIVHSAIVTPRRCGLYETTREIVAAERKLGIDARIFDPSPKDAPTRRFHVESDRGVPTCDEAWAAAADVVFSHSGHDGTVLSNTRQPIFHVAHGRPVSTFLGEHRGDGIPAYSYGLSRRGDPRYKGCLTFWPEYEPILRLLWHPKPVHVVNAPCDSSFWCAGATDYDFAGRKAAYNVVLADPWSREDVHPVQMIHAFALFRAIVPEARLHVYALDEHTKGIPALKAILGDGMGVVQRWAADLLPVYRAAQMLVTPNRIHTRAVREAMSCGMQVVSGRDANPDDPEAFAWAMAKRRDEPLPTAAMAAGLFDPAKAAASFIRLAASCMGRKEAVA